MRLIDADALDYELGTSDRDIYVRECLAEAPSVVVEPHWIPVTEGLPEELELVIMTVYRTDKSYNQGPYIRIGFRRSETWYPIPQESAPFERNLSSYDGGNPVVTAWMPLPEPYKGVTE